MFYISNELSHHGVKGQKWGVRRKEKQRERLERKIGESATKTAREVTNYKRTSQFVIDGRPVTIKNKASDKYYKNAKKYQSQGEKYMKKYKKKFGVQVYGRTGIDYSNGKAYIQVKYGENGEIREYR